MAKKKAKVSKKKASKKTSKKKTLAKKAGSAKKTKTKTVKKASKKKVAKAASKTKASKSTAVGGFEKVAKARTKVQVLSAISDKTGLSKKEVGGVFDTLGDLIGFDLNKGPGAFTVPGLMKVVVVRKPATKSRKGINPFTGEETVFKAKPARNVVKVRPLKGLKEKV